MGESKHKSVPPFSMAHIAETGKDRPFCTQTFFCEGQRWVLPASSSLLDALRSSPRELLEKLEQHKENSLLSNLRLRKSILMQAFVRYQGAALKAHLITPEREAELREAVRPQIGYPVGLYHITNLRTVAKTS